MPKKTTIPDAWDDDWETLADKPDLMQTNQPQEPVKISKAEQKARHQEKNRELWDAAENPEPEIFLLPQNNVPFQSSYKPPVTLLSRKPPAKVLSRNDTTAATSGFSIDESDDSEEEKRKKAEEDFAERKARADKEREEKLRKYAEAREKIFGSPAPSSGDSRGASPSKPTRGRGRGRGGRDSQPRSSNEHSPARATQAGRQLYDPLYTPKHNSVPHQKQDSKGSRPGTPNGLQQAIREPRGPHGRGFAPRGNHSASSV